jgi:hypothetical protein
MSKWLLYWRIATTSGGLAAGHFFARKLPPPSQPVYLDYSVKAPQSQGGLTRQGYDNIRLLWDEMDGLQLKTLRGLVEAGITAGALYLTIDRADGTGIVNDFIDVHGLPQPVEFQPVQNGRGMVFTNVTLMVNALVIDNDPSLVL